MIRLRHKLLIHFLRFIDQAVLIVCLGYFGNALVDTYRLTQALAILVLLMCSMFVFNHFVRYDVNRFTAFADQVSSLLKASSLTVVLFAGISLLFRFPLVSAADIMLVWASATGSILAIRLIIQELLKYSRRSGMTSRQLLIVGFNAQARGLAAKFDSCPELGYRILGFVSADGDEASVVPQGTDAARWNICGRVSELQTILERTSVDELLICLPLNRCYSTIGQIVRLGEQLGIVVRVIPDPESEAPLLRRTHLEFFEGQFVVVFFRESLLFQLMIKRLVDIVASLTLLVMLSPLLAVVAILIKLTSKGPILFVQQRVGMNRRLFKLYKFRSMTADADRRKEELLALNEMDGPVFKIKNDPRVTPFGRFIRKTSIDELPQLFNVFGGSMSLVGPRPPVPSEVEKYEWLFHRRLSIRPGITCLWQVAGRNEISFKEWMELDKEYVTNWSVWLDLKILCRTIPVVLMCRGAS
jgi:exopolysaccharide biosynthesis polyprenyl glycosylphosphotransferase